MRRGERDEDYGLTPRDWLESDAVPLTADVDLNDPEQRIAWIRANNEENFQRSLELRDRRELLTQQTAARTAAAGRRSTTVVAVRMQNPEHRALVRLARREGVTVSDLLRRWARAGLDAANGTAPADAPRFPEPSATDGDRAAEQVALRQAVADAADAAVQRITDDLRRLREIAVTSG